MIIDGKQVALNLRKELKKKLESLASEARRPKLSVVLVGEDPASEVYVGMKEKACLKIGIESEVHRLPASSKQSEVESFVHRLSQDPSVDGILVQLPLPGKLEAFEILQKIDPLKDVDGLTAHNQGLLALGKEGYVPCTPKGVMALLEAYDVQLEGKLVGVLGRSQLVGMPVARLALKANATVIQLHSRSKNSEEIVRQCDVVICAVGKPHLLDDRWIKPGAVVIDVGVHRDGKNLIGDVNFDVVESKASLITPVPKGVGPMTIACLLENCFEAYCKREHLLREDASKR